MPDTQSITLRCWNKFIIYNPDYDTPYLHELFKNPDLGLQQHLLKHDTSVKIDSTIVGHLTLGPHSLVVKRYNIKSFFHGLKKCLWQTRAKKCWKNAARLLNLGFSTPTPVAMIEKRFGPFRRQSYYIYEYKNGVPLKELLLKTSETNAIDLLIETLKQFRKHRIYHGDMKLLNFLVDGEKLIILDLDSMRFYKSSLFFQFLDHKDAEHVIKVNFQKHPELLRAITKKLAFANLLRTRSALPHGRASHSG